MGFLGRANESIEAQLEQCQAIAGTRHVLALIIPKQCLKPLTLLLGGQQCYLTLIECSLGARHQSYGGLLFYLWRHWGIETLICPNITQQGYGQAQTQANLRGLAAEAMPLTPAPLRRTGEHVSHVLYKMGSCVSTPCRSSHARTQAQYC